jgi:hypothetical protein
VVTLTASPFAGSTFTGWSGACTNSTGTCQVTMSAARSVTATFTLNTYTLTVSKFGTGSGTVVTSSPTGINCGSDCSETYGYNTVVTLTATASAGSTFTEWSGACSGTGTCQVNMTAAQSVTATFTPTYALTVSKSGTGSGSVTSSPSGINCGFDCIENYNENTGVTLTATASTSSTFTEWSGACSGTGTCQVAMSAARSVTAKFTLKTYTLTYSAGPGGSISGITPQVVNHGESGTLVSAVPDLGYHFVDWSDGLTDNPRADTSVVANVNVTANFAINTYTLTVSTSGDGTVTSVPSGIDCGLDCSETYNHDTLVTLTATGSTFMGWSGDPDCADGSLTMIADIVCTATFTPTSNPEGGEPTPAEFDSISSTQDMPTPTPPPPLE